MNYIKEYYFPTPIYFIEKPEWVEQLNDISDKFIEEAKKNNKHLISILNKDFGLTHHSNSLTEESKFNEFIKFINKNSITILADQGYNTDLYALVVNACWVQEFSKEGGGHHNSHIHSNCHMSGFYFLKCSDKTSFPMLHDSRLNKRMLQLIEKDESVITDSSEKIKIIPKPGLFMFFPSYLEHEFVVDHGIEPFRFIHFNIQAVPKQLINNDIKRI